MLCACGFGVVLCVMLFFLLCFVMFYLIQWFILLFILTPTYFHCIVDFYLLSLVHSMLMLQWFSRFESHTNTHTRTYILSTVFMFFLFFFFLVSSSFSTFDVYVCMILAFCFTMNRTTCAHVCVTNKGEMNWFPYGWSIPKVPNRSKVRNVYYYYCCCFFLFSIVAVSLFSFVVVVFVFFCIAAFEILFSLMQYA